jgi:hypothetical protein
MLSDPNSQAVMDNRSRCFYSNPLNYLLGGGNISVLTAKNNRVLKVRFPACALIDLQSVKDSNISQPLTQTP